jgi:hypothetical protein
MQWWHMRQNDVAKRQFREDFFMNTVDILGIHLNPTQNSTRAAEQKYKGSKSMVPSWKTYIGRYQTQRA